MNGAPGRRPIEKLLVANRGEIARRVLRTCRAMGIATVAVHSDPDAGAPYVAEADEAVALGGTSAAESYLRADAVVEAALASGADAVHPGYGFLSEHAGFASAVEEAGLAYVGPEPRHIALMGDKARAREAARDAGVPTIPGSDGAVADAAEAATVASGIGYPVALKAAGGGGGRGIRIVHDEGALEGQYATASREAVGAFADARVYVERFVAPARHVEVQVLGDGSAAIHLHERECSLQRRRQKVVEETPAPGLDEATRSGLYDAALALCSAIGYRSAGTVEFLVDADTGEFFFIEMNTRIQVEHPVTEVTTGVDLVAEQLRIAGGAPLRLTQDDIAPRGCALELRINAEDPGAGFMPSPGPLERVALPAGPWVRMDTWMETGGEVPPFYDSLLGKLIVWGDDRATALARARRALAELDVAGVKTTASLLGTLLDEDWFQAGDFHTATLETWLETDGKGSTGR
jgi:acetyl-CoA carboxylase, biotin carboxylase subunit